MVLLDGWVKFFIPPLGDVQTSTFKNNFFFAFLHSLKHKCQKFLCGVYYCAYHTGHWKGEKNDSKLMETGVTHEISAHICSRLNNSFLDVSFNLTFST